MKYSFTDIARFVRGEMTTDEATAMQTAIEKSPELEREVALYQLTEVVLKQEELEKAAERQRFRAELIAARAEMEHSAAQNEEEPIRFTAPPKANNWKWMAGVAATLFVCFFAWKVLFSAPELNSGAMYATYFGIENTMGSDNLAAAHQKYQAKEFGAVIELLKPYQDSSNLQALTLLTQTYLEMNDFVGAKTSLDKLAQVPDNEAEWLRAGMYLKQGDITNAKKTLQIVIASNSAKKGKAKKLLEDLANF